MAALTGPNDGGTGTSTSTWSDLLNAAGKFQGTTPGYGAPQTADQVQAWVNGAPVAPPPGGIQPNYSTPGAPGTTFSFGPLLLVAAIAAAVVIIAK